MPVLRSGVRPRPQCCGKHFGIGAAIPGYQPLEAHDFSRGSSHYPGHIRYSVNRSSLIGGHFLRKILMRRKRKTSEVEPEQKKAIKIPNKDRIETEIFFLKKECDRAFPILERECRSLDSVDSAHYIEYWLIKLEDRIACCRQELQTYVNYHKNMLLGMQ